MPGATQAHPPTNIDSPRNVVDGRDNNHDDLGTRLLHEVALLREALWGASDSLRAPSLNR